MTLVVNTVTKSPGIYVVAPVGRIDGTDRGMLLEQIDLILKENPEAIIFDMERVDYINSLGIRILMKANSALKPRGGEIAFINLPPQTKKVFEILNILPALEVFANIQTFDDYLWNELKIKDDKVDNK